MWPLPLKRVLSHPGARSRFVRTATVWSLLLAQGVARAEPDKRASEFFRAGEASYARHDFPAAARSFEEAHRRAPHAATLYNAGLAWEWAQEASRAADDYEAALTLGELAPRQKLDASARLARLEKGLGHIHVAAPVGATVSVAHLEQGTIPLSVHVPPGEHVVRMIRRDGRRDARNLAVASGQTVQLTFAPESPVVIASATAPERGPASVAAPSNETRRWGWMAIGSAVALGGGAVYLGVAALNARDRYDASAHTDLDAYQRAATLRRWTNVCWVGAGLAAATGLVVVLSGPRAAGASAAEVALTPRAVLLRASF